MFLQVKAETDLYLRQLEKEGRAEETYGKGVQLIAPTPCFVLKTADTKSGEKLFINVCSSEKVSVDAVLEGHSVEVEAALQPHR